MTLSRRIKKHTLFKDLCKNPPDNVSVGLVDDSNIYEWELMLIGPDGTLYEGGFFNAVLKVSRKHPTSSCQSTTSAATKPTRDHL